MKLLYGLLLCQEHKHIYVCVWYLHAHADTHKTQHNTTYICLFQMVQRGFV